MKVLLIKTSSLGDVVHALPAVTEAAARIDQLEVTWVVEEGFADIPRRHPAIHRVIPVAIRRWRKQLPSAFGEIRAALTQLKDEQYDRVIDSQGLLKSAMLTMFTRGDVHGFDRSSAREGLAASFYRSGHVINVAQHAVHRQKQLMAAALGYRCDDRVEYGLADPADRQRRILLLHGTTWVSKEWPLPAWQRLAQLIDEAGFKVLVPSGNPGERQRAEQITAGLSRGRILDRLPLEDLISEMASCAGVVSVDTGLGHLAPALGIPVVGLFGATSPGLTGILGNSVETLVSNHLPCIPCRKRVCQYPAPRDSSKLHPPCFDKTTPEGVWRVLQDLIE